MSNNPSSPPEDWLDSHSVLAAFLITTLSLITIICLYFLWVNPQYITPWRTPLRRSIDLEKGRNGGRLPPAISPSKWRVDGQLPGDIVMPRRKEPMPPTPPILRKEPSTPTRVWCKEPSTPTTPTKAAESGLWERPFPPPPIRMDPHGSWSSFSTTSTMVAKPNKDRFSLPALDKSTPTSPLRDRGSIGSIPRPREGSNLRHFSMSGDSTRSFPATVVQPSIEDHEPQPVPSTPRNSVPGATSTLAHRRSTSSTSSKRNSKRSSLTISIPKASTENPETSIIITAEQPDEAPYAVELSPPTSRRKSRTSLSESPSSRPVSVSFSIPDTPNRSSKRSSASRASMKRVGQNQSRFSLTFPGQTLELAPPVPAVASHFRGSIHMPTVRKPTATSHVPFPATGGRPMSSGSGGWAQLPDGSADSSHDDSQHLSRPDSYLDRPLVAPNLPFAHHGRRDSEMSYKSYKSHYSTTSIAGATVTRALSARREAPKVFGRETPPPMPTMGAVPPLPHRASSLPVAIRPASQDYTASTSTVAERRGPWLHAQPTVL